MGGYGSPLASLLPPTQGKGPTEYPQSFLLTFVCPYPSKKESSVWYLGANKVWGYSRTSLQSFTDQRFFDSSKSGRGIGFYDS